MTDIEITATPQPRMTVHANPFAALSDDDLLAELGVALDTTDPAVLPDPAYLLEQRRLFVDLCDLYGAGNVCHRDNLPEDDDMLVGSPTIWRVPGIRGAA